MVNLAVPHPPKLWVRPSVRLVRDPVTSVESRGGVSPTQESPALEMSSAPTGSGSSSELAKEIAAQLSSPVFLGLIKEAVRAVREEEKMEEEAERAVGNLHSVRISGEPRPDKAKRPVNGSSNEDAVASTLQQLASLL